MFNWLTIELTNRCNKSCGFCGRAKIRDKMELGEMDFKLFRKIIKEYDGDILQFSRDGEPLMYSRLREVGDLVAPYFTNVVTNGILLWEKKTEVLNFDTITVSVIEDDDMQFNAIKSFVEWNKGFQPNVLIKFLGSYYNPEFEKLGLHTMRRTLHNPEGDWDYEKKGEIIPEIGVCLDFMMKHSINWKGEFFICNRFDPGKKGKIGDVNSQRLKEIWKSEERLSLFNTHRKGLRKSVLFCSKCEFWGIPRYI